MIYLSRRRPGRVWLSLLMGLVGGLLGAAVLMVVRGGGGVRTLSSGVGRPYTEVVEAGAPASSKEGIVLAVKEAGPAVVNIDTLVSARGGGGLLERFFGEEGGEIREGQGSGFIINGKEGLVVTNNHVVRSAQRIRVNLPDKRAYDAQIVGVDPNSDIALLRIRPEAPLPEVKLGDSDRLEIGQVTVAMGNPFGFNNSVTSGVLSARERSLPASEGSQLEDLLQTDAAINPGNSGGPLCDAYGRVIGMNTAILSQGQGLGFAVAVNQIKRSVQDILQFGHVRRPWLGVVMRELTPDLAEALHVPQLGKEGVVIREVVPGSPANRAGLQPEDVIVSTDGKPVKRTDELRRVIRQHSVGQKMQLSGFRDGKQMKWTVELGEMPPPDRLPQP